MSKPCLTDRTNMSIAPRTDREALIAQMAHAQGFEEGAAAQAKAFSQTPGFVEGIAYCMSMIRRRTEAALKEIDQRTNGES